MEWLMAVALLPAVLGNHGLFDLPPVHDPSSDLNKFSPFPPETSSCCPQIPWLPKKLNSLDEKVTDFDKRNSRVYKRLSVFIDELNQFEASQKKIDDYIVNTKISIYENGMKGEKGFRGVRGEEGDPGNTGIKGLDGHTGKTGRRGFLGNPGAPGIKGSDGQPGFKGPQGPSGPLGDPASVTKEHGDTGARGTPGLPGPIGDTGPRGAPGETGYQGRKGPKGTRGADCCYKKKIEHDAWSEPEWPGSLA